MTMTSIYGLTNGFLCNGEFFLGVQWSSKKNQYLPEKKHTHTTTDQPATSTLPKDNRENKKIVKCVQGHPSKTPRQPSASVIWPVDWGHLADRVAIPHLWASSNNPVNDEGLHARRSLSTEFWIKYPWPKGRNSSIISEKYVTSFLCDIGYCCHFTGKATVVGVVGICPRSHVL